MKIAACQFAVTGDIEHNAEIMRQYALYAGEKGVELLIFPECALTGYPPLDMPFSGAVDFAQLDNVHRRLQDLADANGLHILTGTIVRLNRESYNSAMLLSPGEEPSLYHKRALWGWDRDNFVPGTEKGIFHVGKLKIGVRICYEVRFPEYFRELFREKTDLNIVLFHDSDNAKNPERYEVLKAHLRTRASENVTPLLSVNTTLPFQTAPTAFFDRSGTIVSELACGKEGMLVCDYQPQTLSFSENGRRVLSNRLLSEP